MLQVEKEREKEVSDDEAEPEEEKEDEETPKVRTCTLFSTWNLYSLTNLHV